MHARERPDLFSIVSLYSKVFQCNSRHIGKDLKASIHFNYLKKNVQTLMKINYKTLKFTAKLNLGIYKSGYTKTILKLPYAKL